MAQRQQLACLNDAYQRLANEMNERLYAQAGLEMRQPFWNARIVEFALATPERSRLRGQEDKWLHRRAMKGLLPENVLQRSSKAEFSVTFARYWADLGPHLTGSRSLTAAGLGESAGHPVDVEGVQPAELLGLAQHGNVGSVVVIRRGCGILRQMRIARCCAQRNCRGNVVQRPNRFMG